MEKKAVLVTFTITTRVVVPTHWDDERIIGCASDGAIKQLENSIDRNSNANIVDDVECPYDPETDVRPKPGVWDGH